jgi:hypothetical protein
MLSSAVGAALFTLSAGNPAAGETTPDFASKLPAQVGE